MKISRRNFTQDMLSSVLTVTLVKSLDGVDALGSAVKPVVRKWLVDMEHVTQQLRAGKVSNIDWQTQIETLLTRVDLNDLLRAIDFDKLAKEAVFPEDHESATDVDFSKNKGLPDELSFAPYFYAMKKGTAIVPHAHHNMASMHMMIKGTTQCWQYERVSDELKHLIIKPTSDHALGVGAVTTVSENRTNVHWFKALSEPVFMFNIGVFGINPKEKFDGRDCIDPLRGEKLSGGLIRARRIEVKEAYALYGKS